MLRMTRFFSVYSYGNTRTSRHSTKTSLLHANNSILTAELLAKRFGMRLRHPLAGLHSRHEAQGRKSSPSAWETLERSSAALKAAN